MAEPGPEIDTAGLRRAMVTALVERGAVTNPELRNAFLAVPRHLFVPTVSPAEAYVAHLPIATHFGADGVSISSSSAPNIMARMLEGLACRAGDRVLEVGTGTGYNAALLATLVGPEGKVTSIELEPSFAHEAEAHLHAAGIETVRVRAADGWLGDPSDAPFDGIVVTACVSDVAPAWFAQLRPGGRLVTPLRLGPGLELAVTFERQADRFSSRAVEWCGFMPLRGDHAPPDRGEDVGDWRASFAGATPERVRQLTRLLAGPGRREPVRPRPRLWFARLVLREPGAVHLARLRDRRRTAWGCFDAARDSLAVIEGETLTAYGGDTARARVLAHAIEQDAWDVRGLTIDVVPTDSMPNDSMANDAERETDTAGGLVIQRPWNRFVLYGLDEDQTHT